MTPAERNASYRETYRAEHIHTRYRGWVHIVLTTVVTTSAVAFAAWSIKAPSLVEWLTIPTAFLIANVAEYTGHRYPMHHAMPGLRAMCVRHAGQHHRFYTHQFMTADKACDWQIILFPPVMLAFFLGGIAVPIAVVLFWVASSNVAWFFVGTAAAYCLTYEWLHLAYHQDPSSFVGRRRLVRKLRWLHLVHHDPGQMTKGNFNITFPIFDLLVGTFINADGYKNCAPATRDTSTFSPNPSSKPAENH